MRVVRAARFGGPEVLVMGESPDPVAGPGEVVVDVSMADVLGIDTAIRSGEGREYFGIEPPFVPGTGVGGEVISAGEDVDPAWVGRRVVAITGVSGGYAERAVVPEQELIAVPDELDLNAATALINDGRTALALIEGGDIQPGDWTLVMPAGSGLGLLLTQFARAAGARVVAAAGSAAKLGVARESGAEVTVNYTEDDWTGRIAEATGGGVNVVFDGVGGSIGRAAFEATARGGRFAAFGDSGGAYAEPDDAEAGERGVIVLGTGLVHIGGTEKAKRLAERALSDAADGGISPVIGQTFPMYQAAKAHEALESRRAVGKTLIVVKPRAPFTEIELEFLGSQLIGRLATVQPNGALQNSPVGFRYNPETATIDIPGYEMGKSRKYKNVVDNGRAAFVVDDVLSTNPWRVRCLEVRGRAEGIETLGDPLIRIHPERIIEFGVAEPHKDPHELEGDSRNADEPPERSARNRARAR